MRLLNKRQKLVTFGMLALLLALALPGTAFADQRNRGRYRDDDRSDKKCGKFVNCHDARDGRWDGKGPRRNRDRRFSRRHRSNDRWDDRWDNDRFGNRDYRRRDYDREVNRTNTSRVRRNRG